MIRMQITRIQGFGRIIVPVVLAIQPFMLSWNQLTKFVTFDPMIPYSNHMNFIFAI